MRSELVITRRTTSIYLQLKRRCFRSSSCRVVLAAAQTGAAVMLLTSSASVTTTSLWVLMGDYYGVERCNGSSRFWSGDRVEPCAVDLRGSLDISCHVDLVRIHLSPPQELPQEYITTASCQVLWDAIGCSHTLAEWLLGS
jgi:hypothetical protein